ncbi:L-cysteine desulfidase [Peptoclostridium litorale DSM 5388]|uniref:UPF0597 protein CLIT_10c00340 n=1 Tax=Peptoclostridium litorale DSM 5388 TaxID=1121324 RepID=A0A069RM78_PEPLI|nr:L-serine ammonia-lyase, iron-sulfur-dependent, subunit alpha [Peptoclostridium litorale]KDR93880.1 hypothetical protein UPF0597 [Peptoclostridium litorale DSM 5388]KDR95307.1 hypothetical protein UPF0597 [Peptoclostridium litorale DSM 5388]SIN87765.1 L-cysteine desulfidase [Peptoclostridium litorale DSM 5388]
MKDVLIQLLKSEVKPALGCTEPGAVALAVARAREVLGHECKECSIEVSANIYKNGMGVGIPGSNGKVGLEIAAAMGLLGGDSGLGLDVLESVKETQLDEAQRLVDEGFINISPLKEGDRIFTRVVLKSEYGTSEAVISTKHDNFILIKKDDETILNTCMSNAAGSASEGEESPVVSLSIRQLIETVEKFELKEIEFLIEGISMNKKMAEKGLYQKLGAGVGYSLKKAIEDGFISADLINMSMMVTAAASDARMSGVKMSVMSSNGSGNHGLTAILPIAVYNDKYPQSDDRLAKALAISHLVISYVKNYTGRLSAVCGCGVAASVGSAAAITWLMGLGYDGVEGAINNMIANLSGMVCDGAKAGCAYKLSSAAAAAMQSAINVKYGSIVPKLNGIVGETVEQSIRNLGEVSGRGMRITDDVIVDVMDGMNKNKGVLV